MSSIPKIPQMEAPEKLKIVLNEAENVKLTALDAYNFRTKIVKK